MLKTPQEEVIKSLQNNINIKEQDKWGVIIIM